MIRVGFILSFTSSGWTGGVNYYANLLNATAASDRVRPVILTGSKTPESALAAFPGIEVVRSPLVEAGSRWTLARRVAEKLAGRAFVLERLLQRHRIDVLSHSGHLGPRSNFPSIGWIPDFQHLRCPEFFSPRERAERDGTFARLGDYCTRVIVSSEDARSDLAAFRPSAVDRARVLPFVSALAAQGPEAPTRADLLARYDLPDVYFHLPNQFWVHKNHLTVVEALHRLRSKGRPVTVAATGNTRDFRRPDHFETLMRRVSDLGLERDFRILGLVPYGDLTALMRDSVGLINPSLFEGWSTTVEESKTLGKTIVLSDIPVHREQAPPFGHFFPPTDAAALAATIEHVIDAHSPQREADQRAAAARDLPERVAAFVRRYEDIVVDAVEAKR